MFDSDSSKNLSVQFRDFVSDNKNSGLTLFDMLIMLITIAFTSILIVPSWLSPSNQVQLAIAHISVRPINFDQRSPQPSLPADHQLAIPEGILATTSIARTVSNEAYDMLLPNTTLPMQCASAVCEPGEHDLSVDGPDEIAEVAGNNALQASPTVLASRSIERVLPSPEVQPDRHPVETQLLAQ